MTFWLSVALNVIAIALVYYGLFGVMKAIYKKGLVWLVAFLILLSPFAYVLFQVKSLLELMWVLLLTPFYAIAFFLLFCANWLLLYYGVAYAALALIHYLRKQINSQKEQVDYAGPGQGAVLELDVRRSVLPKFLNWCFILLLAVTLGATLIGGLREGIRDPTFQEAREFIAFDQTDLLGYTYGSFTCHNFAMTFRDNALEARYRCGYALLFFHNKTHALNCFNTTDQGLIFVEPQTDGIVEIAVGQPYWERGIYAPPEYNDTIIAYHVFWETP
jgi:hypothetical protein